MHRSGTSFLVGSLQQHGVFLGKHHTWNEFNVRGNRENQDIWDLQDEILRENGGSWQSPPAAVEWKPEHFDRARQILAEYAEHRIWGFKDPRTLLTLPGWQQLVPDLEQVGIFRHPLRVAQSLARRNDMPLEQALELWRLYNQRLLRIHGQRPFPILSFDEEAPVLEAKLLQVAGQLGLQPGPVDEPFFAAELRQAGAEGGPLPAPVESLYRKLLALSL
jgi:hypothetical protein